MLKFIYDSVALIKHAHARDSESLPEYFIPAARRFFLILIDRYPGPGTIPRGILVEEYRDGAHVSSHVVHRWLRADDDVACSLSLLTFALRHLPARTWILTLHPQICVHRPLLHLLRKHRVLFIVGDLFRHDRGTVSGRIRDCFIQSAIRASDVVFCISPLIFRYYRWRCKSMGAKPSRFLEWHLGIKVRTAAQDRRLGALSRAPRFTIGYIGLVREGIGLFRLLSHLASMPNISLDIVGNNLVGDRIHTEIARLDLDGRVRLLGFQPTTSVREICTEWLAGVALYGKSHYCRYTEPGKIKLYLSLGLPVIMTDVSYIASEVRAANAGVVIDENTYPQFSSALALLATRYDDFLAGVQRMAAAYEFKSKYDSDFAFMRKHPHYKV